MSLTVGIVGLPNVGKSTLFNALLKKQQALVANYPFATIEPNVGVVPVPEPRLQVLADITEAADAIPAAVEFIDIAGLVENAHKGEGLGNQFLSHIREVDLICHVLRIFDEEGVHHVTGSVNPLRDKEIVETELMLADLTTLEKQVEPKGQVSKEEEERWRLIQKLKKGVGESETVDRLIGETEKGIIGDLHLLTTKPVLYIANISEGSLTDQYDYQGLVKQLDNTVTREQIVPICAQVEQDIADFSKNEQSQYLKSLGLKESGLEILIRKAYSLLNYITFFTTPTSKANEVRAWKIVAGSSAVEAAGEVHSDFADKFIKAEVVSFLDFEKRGGWKGSFEKGEVRIEGRDYVMQDGDVVRFKV